VKRFRTGVRFPPPPPFEKKQPVSPGSLSSRKQSFDPRSARYDFRVFLLHLWLIGDEFKTARKHLLAALPGDSAFKRGRPKPKQQTATKAESPTEAGHQTRPPAFSGDEPAVTGNIASSSAPSPPDSSSQTRLYHKALAGIDNRTTLLLGHTRWRTRGNERINCNNHPIQGILDVQEAVVRGRLYEMRCPPVSRSCRCLMWIFWPTALPTRSPTWPHRLAFPSDWGSVYGELLTPLTTLSPACPAIDPALRASTRAVRASTDGSSCRFTPERASSWLGYYVGGQQIERQIVRTNNTIW